MHGTIMKLPGYAKVGLAILCILLACLLTVTAFHRYRYPYGRRPGGISLPGLYGSLVAYAGEHNGWFPRSDKGPYDALQQLYDSYCPSGKELAGVSGNADAVTEALRKGKPLDASLTSWVYVPGFKRGDPGNAAILWESKPGLYYDGRRNDFGGRAVLLLNGDITNVPAADWAGFLKQQEELRKAVQSRTNGLAPAAH